jgi:hypothetical protein
MVVLAEVAVVDVTQTVLLVPLVLVAKLPEKTETELEKAQAEAVVFIPVLAEAALVTLYAVAMVVLELFTLGTRRKGRLTNGNS